MVAFLYLLTSITQVVDVADEGIPTYGAQRILNGDIPYNDFWTIYAPGQFYVLAGLFKIFGSSILVERLYDITVRTLISTVALLILFRMAGPAWAVGGWFFITLWLKYFGYFTYPNFPTILFSLAGLYLLLDYFHKVHPKRRLFFSGALTSLALLFRQDSGFYLFLSQSLVVFPFAYLHLTVINDGKEVFGRFVKLVPFVSVYLLGVLLPLLPAGIYFLSAVPPRTLMDELIIFPLKVFPAVREIPFPFLLPDASSLIQGKVSFFAYLALLSERWSFYFSLSVLLAASIFFVLGRHQRPKGKKGNRPVLIWSWEAGLFLVFGLFSFNTLRVRSDLPHLLPLFVSAVLLSAALGPRLVARVRRRKGLIGGALVLGGGLLVVYPIYRWLTPEMEEKYRTLFLGHGLERARHVRVNPNQAEAIRYIRSVTFPWERIFVGDNRHDLIYNNDIMFYFLSERHSATKYHELFPGLATSRPVQEQIIRDLQKNNVRYVVLLSRFQNPGVTTEPVPVRVLDDFIAQNYQPVKKFGDWSVWESK